MKWGLKMCSEDKNVFFEHTFCQIFHKTAMEYPDKIAVESESRSLSYQELDEYSNFLARILVGSGVKREEFVAIQTGRDVETIIGILAVLKAGAAYLYIDESYPEARREIMQRECQFKVTLTREYFENLAWERRAKFFDRSKREELAVMIYTSGSTSAPKGVMLEHRNIMASISNMDRLGLNQNDKFCAFASFGFVASVYDVFSTLLVGATLVIIPEYRRRKIDLITQFYREKGITVTFLPPHMAMKLMQCDDSHFHLRLLLVGSEPVRNLQPKSYQIINTYAASELCGVITLYEITSSEKSYPIGTFNPTIKGYIVDDKGNLTKPGEEGELWLSGPQVCRGYYQRPEATKAQFIENPFPHPEGFERVFQTRDIVCLAEDGNLRYICRKDNMFKIRGFRVESGAVEVAILKCSSIKEVVVKAFEDNGGCNILCAYFVAEEQIDVKELKRKLKQIIPYYMVPTAMFQLERFVRNANNKIDRQALKAPKELNDYKLLETLY